MRKLLYLLIVSITMALALLLGCQNDDNQVSLEAGLFDLRSPSTVPIQYYGGSVMTSPINVYFLWYGSWTNTKVPHILEDLIKNVDDSAWYQINTAYCQAPLPDAGSIDAGVTESNLTLYVNGRVNFIQSVYLGYPNGSSLQDTDIATIIGETVAKGALSPDPDGMYVVLVSSDVSVEEFCYSYCAWHDNQTILGQNFHIAFVGDTGACQHCNLQAKYNSLGLLISPNGDWSADSMASVLLHELAETSTDPNPSSAIAWQDETGRETADKCAWTFGQTYLTSNGSAANMPIGNRDFMIQQNWVLDADGGHCGLTP